MAAIIDTIPDGIDLRLITRDRDFGSSERYPGLSGRWVSRGRSRIFYLNTHKLGHWRLLRRELRATQFDLLYVNSLWEPTFTVIPVVAARLRLIHTKLILLAPRGELAAGALSLKARKKRLFMKVWRPFLNSMNVLWHASTDLEAADIRGFFPSAEVEVNQDQVYLPSDPLPVPPLREGPTRLVYIGRISAVKNLDLVLRSMRSLSRPVEFDIYGPLEDPSYWSSCQVLVTQAPDHVRIRYMGELAPADVRRTFSAYDAFVFPTKGESFGHAIAESLSASCPVICSADTPWTAVLAAGGGAVVHPLTTRDFAAELERLAAMTPHDRLAARHAAANAYRAWRAAHENLNPVERVHLARSVPKG